jgi:hypothetical protein
MFRQIFKKGMPLRTLPTTLKLFEKNKPFGSEKHINP